MVEAIKALIRSLLKLEVIIFAAHLISRAVQANSNSLVFAFADLPSRIFSYKPLTLKLLLIIPKMVAKLVKLAIKLILSILDVPVSVIWNLAKLDKFTSQPKFSEMI